MGFNLLSKVGAVLAVIGVIGFVLFGTGAVTAFSIKGQDFVSQASTDANGDQTFADFKSGDEVIIVDTMAHMEYDADEDKTRFWLDSVKDGRIYFECDSNIEKYRDNQPITLKLEIVSEGQGEKYLCEASGRLSTTIEYVFVGLTVAGIGLLVFGFVRSRRQSSAPLDDWGLPAPPAMASAPVAPPAMAPPAVPPPQVPSSNSQINPDVTGMSFSAVQPASMTITVPPGVVPGQVLTVTMPSGQVVNVQVPPGCAPGSQFTISVTQ